MTPDVLDDWRVQAKCRQHPAELFFPTHPEHGDRRSAYEEPRQICAGCWVRRQCLDLVIDLPPTADQWGMYGGYSPAERQRIRLCRAGLCEHSSHRGRNG